MIKIDLSKTILLNSARNCLRYLVRVLGITKIYIPYYICPVVWQSLRKENVKILFYHIDKNFFPTICFNENDYILYPNYFGICNKNSEYLALKYKNLILDNSQAFYGSKTGLASFLSPRKFFNVNDGGILFCKFNLEQNFVPDKDRDYIINSFDDFCKNELSLNNQPIKLMSEKTKSYLKNLNFEKSFSERKRIFQRISNVLKNINDFKFLTDENIAPMIYPIISKYNANIKYIMEKYNIYPLKFWTKLPNNFLESYFQNKIMGIPLTLQSVEIIEKFI